MMLSMHMNQPYHILMVILKAVQNSGNVQICEISEAINHAQSGRPLRRWTGDRIGNPYQQNA